jgi:ribonuclease-3
MSNHSARASVPIVNLPHLDELERKIGYMFRDRTHLTRAMIHASRAARDEERARTGTLDHNAALEYIGDGVLRAAVRQYVYAKQGFGMQPFQNLYQMAELLEQNVMQSYAAGKLELDQHVFVTLSERRHRIRADKKSHYDDIMACAYEAMIGAVYVDGGMAAAHDVLARTFFVYAEPHLVPAEKLATLLEPPQKRLEAP